MNTNSISVVVLAICAIVIFYAGYMFWFRPEKYTDDLVRKMKDMMPSAYFFHSYFKSSQYIWSMRFGTLFFMAFFTFVFIRMILSYVGFLP